MDVFKFINSRDIREYLQKINYSFSPLEIAWLVKKSKYTTLKEKHKAWREIISTMPDCEICENEPSLHEYLNDRMYSDILFVSGVKAKEPNTVFSFKWFIGSDKVAIGLV